MAYIPQTMHDYGSGRAQVIKSLRTNLHSVIDGNKAEISTSPAIRRVAAYPPPDVLAIDARNALLALPAIWLGAVSVRQEVFDMASWMLTLSTRAWVLSGDYDREDRWETAETLITSLADLLEAHGGPNLTGVGAEETSLPFADKCYVTGWSVDPRPVGQGGAVAARLGGYVEIVCDKIVRRD